MRVAIHTKDEFVVISFGVINSFIEFLRWQLKKNIPVARDQQDSWFVLVFGQPEARRNIVITELMIEPDWDVFVCVDSGAGAIAGAIEDLVLIVKVTGFIILKKMLLLQKTDKLSLTHGLRKVDHC